MTTADVDLDVTDEVEPSRTIREEIRESNNVLANEVLDGISRLVIHAATACARFSAQNRVHATRALAHFMLDLGFPDDADTPLFFEQHAAKYPDPADLPPLFQRIDAEADTQAAGQVRGALHSLQEAAGLLTFVADSELGERYESVKDELFRAFGLPTPGEQAANPDLYPNVDFDAR